MKREKKKKKKKEDVKEGGFREIVYPGIDKNNLVCVLVTSSN